MPLLKYRCAGCDTVFEALVSAREMDTVRCAGCGSREVARAYEGACLFGTVTRSPACEGAPGCGGGCAREEARGCACHGGQGGCAHGV